MAQRLAALQSLSQAIARPGERPLHLSDLQSRQSSPGERVLLERIGEFLGELAQLPPDDLRQVQRVLAIIASGQELDLVRFEGVSEARILPLRRPDELDDYTYRVAGCVGEFWTSVCFAHLRPAPRAGLNLMLQLGVRFGKGLQLVNILRDLPKDLRAGRCYLPEAELSQAGLRPADLLVSRNEARLRPIYDRWLDQAADHLRSGWEYVLNLPASWVRVRLACAWPVLIGMATLEKLRREEVLNPEHRIKVSRPEVKRIMRASVLALPFRKRWSALPRSLHADF